MNKNKSIATIDAPEFINVTEISPLISKCTIKVFYLGKNRNGSYIDKETAIDMAQTLRGNPIVAAYSSSKQDFSDHGEVVHIEDGEITFSCKTVPYGFVAPDAQIWFQKFIDTDEFGNEVEREYMMTTGYLWTGQYEELNSVISEGKGQSMELDPETIEGYWAMDNNSGYEFFIINDATISKLCILGDDVEPCFEGASVTGSVETDFSVSSDKFKETVHHMLFQLKDALQNEGGLNMDGMIEGIEQEELAEETFEVAEQESAVEEETVVDEPVVEDEFAAQDEEEEDDKPADEEEDEEDKPTSNHSLEENEPQAVEPDFQAQLAAYETLVQELQAEVNALREFRLAAENEKKDALIAKYFMLSDADKADVVANKENYSLDEIEAKLAVTYVKVNAESIFNQEVEEDEQVEEESFATNPALAFSLDGDDDFAVSDMLRALRNTKH